MNRQEFLNSSGLQVQTLEFWLEQQWLIPEETSAGTQFSDADVARAHLIHDLKEEGLAGIEVYHSSHHIGQITKLRQWQKEYDLLATGGSDFHGTNKPDIEIGTGRGPLFVPDHLIDDLMN